jgi:hypothetical protein
MSLAPTLSVTLGNLRYDTHALGLQACLAWLPRGSSLEVTVPAGVRFEAAPGDEALLDVDGGEGSTRVLTGKITAVERALRWIRVTAGDAGAALAALRPAKTFAKQNASQVVRALAGDADVSMGRIDLDVDLPAFVAHPQRTAAEHVAELARLGGAVAFADADGELQVVARPEGPAAALLHGREILEYRTCAVRPASPQRFVIGFGPAGSGSAPDALRHSVGPLPASAPSGGAGVLRQPAPALRTPSAATAASNARQGEAGARTLRLWARCFLLPARRPGEVIEVQELPDGMPSGSWLVTRVTHRLDPGAGGETVLEAEQAGAGALGALASLVGGLL